MRKIEDSPLWSQATFIREFNDDVLRGATGLSAQQQKSLTSLNIYKERKKRVRSWKFAWFMNLADILEENSPSSIRRLHAQTMSTTCLFLLWWYNQEAPLYSSVNSVFTRKITINSRGLLWKLCCGTILFLTPLKHRHLILIPFNIWTLHLGLKTLFFMLEVDKNLKHKSAAF